MKTKFIDAIKSREMGNRVIPDIKPLAFEMTEKVIELPIDFHIEKRIEVKIGAAYHLHPRDEDISYKVEKATF